jgi:hypothetical protein
MFDEQCYWANSDEIGFDQNTAKRKDFRSFQRLHGKKEILLSASFGPNKTVQGSQWFYYQKVRMRGYFSIFLPTPSNSMGLQPTFSRVVFRVHLRLLSQCFHWCRVRVDRRRGLSSFPPRCPLFHKYKGKPAISKFNFNGIFIYLI